MTSYHSYNKLLIIAATCCGLLLSGLTGQSQEISLAAGGGIGAWHYSLNNGSRTLQPGFQAGVGYLFPLGNRWGLRTGVELGSYRAKARLNNGTTYSSYQVDSEGDAFEFQVQPEGYQEKQQLLTADVPLLLQFHPAGDQRGFYGAAGVKLGLPIRNRFNSSADRISASGYYPDLNVTFTDLPVHGFGTQPGWSGKAEYDLKPSFALSAEAGMRFTISTKSKLYIGAYIDYGLNDLKKQTPNNQLLTYQPDGLAQSKPAGVFSLPDESGAVRLLAAGIKLRWAIATTRKKKAAPVPAVIAETPAPAPVPADTAAIAITPAPEPVSPVQDTVAATPKPLPEIDPVHFGKVGDTLLAAASKTQLQQLVSTLKEDLGLNAVIEGHTCNVGNNAANEKVGLARARAVKAFLVNQGIAAERLETVSKAQHQPVAPNDTEANRRRNRRVVVKIIE
ncbi:MAG: OmpA family protein [Candidatus Pseudobacter hemicellulosilyticus]|uniref:OmpA family protein n=1 Tax=Candidatus Pseudobacter hemicellulosilyticus TaxID=3121375 RepID=A0AAJ5WS87_9BACT|nr:MAG: OmpA family protein [Pseudobacter sp.]